MNKKVLWIIIVSVVLIIAAVGIGIASLLKNGYLYVGDVWEDTPEQALARRADQDLDSQRRFTIKQLLETQYFDDTVDMTYISEGDTLVTVTFVTNKKGQYTVYGSTEEVDLDSPTEFLLNGDPTQYILFPYQQHDSKVWGWCYTSASFTVNGITPSRRTHRFEWQGKEWEIDFWWIDSVATDAEVQIDYTSK